MKGVMPKGLPSGGGGNPYLLIIGMIGAIAILAVDIIIQRKGDGGGGSGGGSGGSDSGSQSSRGQPILLTNSLTIDYEGDIRRREAMERIAYEEYQRQEREQAIKKRNETVGAMICIVFIIGVLNYLFMSSIIFPLNFVFSFASTPFSFFWNHITLILGICAGVKAIIFYCNDYNAEVRDATSDHLLKYGSETQKRRTQDEINDKILKQQGPLFIYIFATIMLLFNYFSPTDSSKSIFFGLWKNIVLAMGSVIGIKTYSVFYENFGYEKKKKTGPNALKEGRMGEMILYGVMTATVLFYYLWLSSSSLPPAQFESGIDYDFYLDEATPEQAGLSREQQQSIIYDKYYSQKSRSTSPRKVQYMNELSLTSLVDRYRVEREKENRDTSKEGETLITGLLPVPMPASFSYTGAIELNNLAQGLYHSLPRHYSQWTRHLPSLSNIPPLFRNAYDYIEGQRTLEASRNAINEYRNLLTTTSNPNHLFQIHNAQLEMYRFIRNTVTSDNYMGERINFRNQLQVYFKVPGSNEVMVLAMGKELEDHNPQLDPNDVRPFRRIITIFFADNKGNLITKMFDKDGFKKL